jgi:hypothetical protein
MKWSIWSNSSSEMIAEADLDKDKEVSEEEFLKIIRRR